MNDRARTTQSAARERRLGAALRENVKRRRAQARARALAQEAAPGEEARPTTHDSAGIPGDKKDD
jgi:hypothetical protein